MVERTEAFQILWDHQSEGLVVTIVDGIGFRSVLIEAGQKPQMVKKAFSGGFDFSQRLDLEFISDLEDGSLELLGREEMAEW